MGRIPGRITLILGTPLIFVVYIVAVTLIGLYNNTAAFSRLLKKAWEWV